MGSFGGYYKGEKKKPKSKLSKKSPSANVFAPTVSMPQIIGKKKSS